MTVETLDDRKVFVADFGVACTGSPSGGGSVSFTAIYDAQHSLEEAGGFVAFSLDQPRLTCVTSQVSSLAEGDTVTVPVDSTNTDYTVRVVMSDGTGITEFSLEKQ
jgi:hypothetical protein